MADIIDASRRSALMARIRQAHTAPELLVRRVAHAMGLRFRLHPQNLAGRPDVVFPKHKLALFVHGCFWHRHPNCPKCTTPKTRAEFWAAKFLANKERDRRNVRDLRLAGWRVGVIWECQTRDESDLRQRLQKLVGVPRKA